MDINAYFEKHIKYEEWMSYSEDMRSKAIAQAERELTAYQSTVNSALFEYAVAEQALWLLQGDKRADLQQMGVASFSSGSISEQFDTKGRPSYIAPRAWAFIHAGSMGGLKRGALT